MFGKPKLLIYLDKATLTVRHADGEFKLEFPKEAINLNDVVDEAKVHSLIGNFITSNKIPHGDVILVLSEGLVFQKPVTATKSESLEDRVSTFVSEIPFEPAKISYLTYPSGKRVIALGVNKNLYMAVIKGLEQKDFKVKHVIPEVAFNKGDNLIEALKNKKFVKTIDFLVVGKNPVEKTLEVEGTAKSSKKNLVLGLVFVLLMGTAGAIVYFFLVPQLSAPDTTPPENPPPEEVILDTDQPVESETSDSTDSTEEGSEDAPAEESQPQVSREQIQVSVFNGTSVAGLAGRTSGLVQELGYENIETGNSSTAIEGEVSVLYSSNVPAEFIEELEQVLLERFEVVTSTESFEGGADEETEEELYQISIVLGADELD